MHVLLSKDIVETHILLEIGYTLFRGYVCIRFPWICVHTFSVQPCDAVDTWDCVKYDCAHINGGPTFCVVKFPVEGDTAGVVHTRWLRDGCCYFPNEPNSRRLQEMTAKGADPEHSWAKCTYTVMCSSARLPGQGMRPMDHAMSVEKSPNVNSPADNQHSGFQTEVLRLLHTLKIVQQTHFDQLLLLLSKVSNLRELREMPVSHYVQEPFTNVEEFLAFDQQLKYDIEKQNNLMPFMRFIGGTDLGDRASRILPHILSASVAKQFSMRGEKGKRKFVDLHLWKMMCNRLAPDCQQNENIKGTIKDIEQAVQSWLRHAPEAHRRQESKRTEASQASARL